MVTVVNPCNPTGVLLTRRELQELADVCREGGAWLVCDNTYEHFCSYGDEGGGVGAKDDKGEGADESTAGHHCIAGPNVVLIFSFSKVSLIHSMTHRLSRLGHHL